MTLVRPDGTDDLVITVLDSGETITVTDHFVSALSGLEKIVFDDDVFSRADIHAETGGESLTGDGSDQILTGGLGVDLFTLSGGDETVQTGGGRDTIVIGADGGSDRIEGSSAASKVRRSNCPTGCFLISTLCLRQRATRTRAF